MKATFKYNDQPVIMEDGWPVYCEDPMIQTMLESMETVEAVMLQGDVTRSPVVEVLKRINNDITDLVMEESEQIH